MTESVAAFLRTLTVERGASAHTVRSYRTDLAQFQELLARGGITRPEEVDSRAVRACSRQGCDYQQEMESTVA